MKKYLILSFLFLLTITPALAKNSTEVQGQQGQTVVSPTGNQVKNTNEIKTQNQGESQKNNIKTQESEQLNQSVDDSLTKVSDQVHQLIETVGAKGGIGQQVREIAQNQEKVQEKIKSSYYELKNRGQLIRLFVGSDKKIVQALGKMTEENKQTIQQLEEMKTKTKNQADLQQLQETINLILNQNNSLEEKISSEKQVNGLFGWFVKLFSNK
ncbi:MAG TPA: hypothetical protein PK257_02145 [Candidatus Woesebacteria bacterium]|nr:hypothetical protein [Candidatus Woesebacteria bacterium]